VLGDQPPTAHPVIDRLAGEPRSEELSSLDAPMLATGEPSDELVVAEPETVHISVSSTEICTFFGHEVIVGESDAHVAPLPSLP